MLCERLERHLGRRRVEVGEEQRVMAKRPECIVI